VIGTWIYSRARSQLVARSFIFHVARARSIIVHFTRWSLETDRDLHPSSIHRGTVGEAESGVRWP
jgi:hypothetical protein